jgi:hypothetical protein
MIGEYVCWMIAIKQIREREITSLLGRAHNVKRVGRKHGTSGSKDDPRVVAELESRSSASPDNAVLSEFKDRMTERDDKRSLSTTAAG